MESYAQTRNSPTLEYKNRDMLQLELAMRTNNKAWEKWIDVSVMRWSVNLFDKMIRIVTETKLLELIKLFLFTLFLINIKISIQICIFKK